MSRDFKVYHDSNGRDVFTFDVTQFPRYSFVDIATSTKRGYFVVIHILIKYTDILENRSIM